MIEDTPRSQMESISTISQDQTRLNDQQKELIVQSLSRVRNRIAFLAANWKIDKLKYRLDIKTIIDEASSYIPEIVLKLDPTKVDISKQDLYIAQLCFFRMIDDTRRLNRHIRVNSSKRLLVAKIIKGLQKTQMEVTPELIEGKITELGLDPAFFKNTSSPEQVPLDRVFGKNWVTKNKDIDRVDWDDLDTYLQIKADEQFSDLNNKQDQAKRVLIKEYILPRCKGKESKNLEQLSSKLGFTASRLSQILHSDSIKRFFDIYFNRENCSHPVDMAGRY